MIQIPPSKCGNCIYRKGIQGKGKVTWVCSFDKLPRQSKDEACDKWVSKVEYLGQSYK